MKHRSPYVARVHVIKRVEAQLRSNSFPRLQMLLLVSLTGGFGLLASFCMLQLGLDTMAVRYPLALGAAYLFFLLLIWLWLRTGASDQLDIPNIPGLAPSRASSSGPGDLACGGSGDFTSGGGGDFGGGGASASFESPTAGLGSAFEAPAKAVGEAVGAVGDADELAVPLIAVVFAVALAVALMAGLALMVFYVVYIAPVLFAEVLVDGALSYALFRHLRAEDRPFWLASAMRRTLVPFAVTAVFLAAVGAAMAFYAPGAKSLGQVMERASAGAAAR